MNEYFVYILANTSNTTLYTGMTSNLLVRVWQHKRKIHSRSFAARYNVNRLVYFEVFNEVQYAIDRERQIKSWSRHKKDGLIDETNPAWDDLSSEWYEAIGNEEAALW